MATETTSFFSFMRQTIEEMKQNGCRRTSETYSATLSSLSRFCAGNDLYCDEIDSALVVRYESFLRGNGLCPNSSSFYMRIFRAAFNKAVKCGIIDHPGVSPFCHVYTGVDKTVKRAVGASAIRKIKNLALDDRPKLAFVRDIFLFSFYTRGMSLIDMAYLRADQVKENRITYHRRKTGRRLDIRMESPIADIVKRHSNPEDIYLLPLIKHPGANEHRQYHNISHLVNLRLKEIGKMAGIKIPLTMYVARHSWANVARNEGIPLAVISEGMGHASEATTRIYLKSLNNSKIDRANKKIINSI